jgi:Phosphotransferase enzyme family
MERTRILWFGRPPAREDNEQAEDHGFQLVAPITSEEPDFHFARAAIFWGTGSHFGAAAACLKNHVAKALNEGAYVVVVVSGEAGDVRLEEVSKVLKDNEPHGALAERYRIRSAPVSVHQLMNQALTHDSGPAKNLKLVIECPVDMTPAERLLLQRAFHDCTSIRLKPIVRGHSGASTFIVEAILADSNAGPEPQPFFAKLGGSGKLQEEMKRFRQFAEHHIPWYLRPNFLPERSIYGVAEAILVGSFVQGSSSLAESARRGDGAPLIRSLFEETLSCLRRRSRTAEQGNNTSVVDALADFCNHESVPAGRWRAAAAKFGSEPIEPDNLWWQMLSLPARPWRKSAIHGDLHGENVRVRKQDAIVIDFAQACIGPASADLANLEVWLSFGSSEYEPFGAAWKALMDELYSPEAIDASLQSHAALAGPNWIHACVAEVRRLARSAIESKDEYKRVLAVYLLRQASFQADSQHSEEDEFRRTYAYALSCKLVAHLGAEASLTSEAI